MQEAMFWHAKDDNLVHCELCPQYCTIRPGKTGFCRVRKNIDGKLYSLNFNRVAAHATDPMEKKPLYHYYPGKYILSLGTSGCNLRCGFCQNWSIAQDDPETIEVTPEHVAEVAANQDPYPNVGVAYTYSEPFMWYEFIFHTARLVRDKGYKNVLVTNGYINEEPLKALLPYIDAMNIDVKAFTDEFYQENCKGHLEPVKRTVELVHKKCHLELTTLLIPGLNDSDEEISKLVDWVADISPEIPIHFSRYFPNFEFELDATPPERLQRAREIALEKLNYVYIGNLGDPKSMNTYCPQCGKLLVNRTWHNGKTVGVDEENNCKQCGRKIYVIR
ncbi:MAG: AmmeMemoRadiSam system radical SAM enzyme [Firmicutes bacterium]|nr:AmmeMemoRadiSam system radical SAM enzyme [Bacillota bacterium]